MLLPVFLFFLLTSRLPGQRAAIVPAEPNFLPGISDSNNPSFWRGDELIVYQSNGLPIMSMGPGQWGPFRTQAVHLDRYDHVPLWIEAAWTDDDGTVYAWYHHEVWVCGEMAAPEIGALVSRDGGWRFEDLGIVLRSGYGNDCGARNGYFAGGHGDFTVLVDPRREHFYFYFGNYSGPESSQGVAVARMAFTSRDEPAGRVWKFHDGEWREPGLGGRVTAILPVRTPWGSESTDAFWGPALHWNTYLNQYVMLLNRACCEPGWPQAGIYVSFNPDLANPHGWTPPEQILSAGQSGWYPQVIGAEAGMTDKIAGKVARFYMGSDSWWEIVFDW